MDGVTRTAVVPAPPASGTAASAGACLRLAAAGDIHCSGEERPELHDALRALAGEVDLILLAGDLTTHGEPEQAAVLARACQGIDVPVLAVLGNHDWHAGRHDELVAVLAEGGICVLERDVETVQAGSIEVGVVGVKGFVGGFAGSHLPDFGEPLLREVYAETTRDVEALADGLRRIALCQVRIVLMHYAPTHETLVGEPSGIWAFLGSDRFAAPIQEHEPDLVLHGHAHAGTLQGAIGATAVYNVAVQVTGRDFWRFELDVSAGSGPVR